MSSTRLSTTRLSHTIRPYGYDDLPADGVHIRLLILEPGNKEDYLHCHLETVTLEEARNTYECISYVWGDSKEVRRIIVDGHFAWVTLNLFHALQHFRLPDRERALWADAICIQQTNPPEKGRQVQLMGQIYEHSSRTLVWLSMDEDRMAAETTSFIKEQAGHAVALVEKYGSTAEIPDLVGDDNPISRDRQKWALWSRFLQFAWHTRVWVMQEVGIAPDVTIHWGDSTIQLADVINVNELARHAPHVFEILPLSWNLHDVFLGVFVTYGNKNSWLDQVVPDFITSGLKLVPNNSAVDILIQSSRREVTDLRDHVYGLLGHPLIDVEGETIVQADYSRAADDIYMEVTTKLLQHVADTDTLAVAGCMGKRRPRDLDNGQPTWVVRWDLCLEATVVGRPEQWYYAGGKGAKADIKIDGESRTLNLLAVILDTVVWVSDRIPQSNVQIDEIVAEPTRHVAIEWIWEALPEEPCRYTGKHGSRDAYTISLCAGRYRHRLAADEDLPRHRKQAGAYQDYIKSFHGGAGDESLRSDAREFETDHANTAKEKRFLVTKNGFYGLGPQLAAAGDVVAVLPGLTVPFVLRPSGDKFKLVGSSYIHGVMRGEALDEQDPLKLGLGPAKGIVII